MANLFNIMRTLFTAKPGVKPEDQVPIRPLVGQTLYTPLSHNYVDRYEAAFSSVCYSLLKKRSDAMSNLNFLAYTKTSQSELELLPTNHWLVQLFDNPNPEKRKKELFRLIQEWLDLNGNAYIYLPWRSYGYKTPPSMWVLQSTNVYLYVLPEGLIYRYIYNGQVFYFYQDEIIHLRNLMPGSTILADYMGKSLIDTVLDVVESDKELNRYFKKYLTNSALPAFALKNTSSQIGDSLTPEEFNNAKSAFNNAFPNNNLLLNLSGGLSVEPLTTYGINSTTIPLDKMDDVLQRKLAEVFGVPFSLLTGDNTTYASAKLADWQFKSQTIEALAQDITEAFTQFFRQFDPTLTIDFERFVYKDDDIRLKEIDTALRYGTLTPNEVRKEFGYEPIKNGDEPLVNKNYLPLSFVVSTPPTAPAAQNITEPIVPEDGTAQ